LDGETMTTDKALGKKPPKCYCLCCVGSKGDGSIDCNKLIASRQALIEAADELEEYCGWATTCDCGPVKIAKKLRISAGEKGDF